MAKSKDNVVKLGSPSDVIRGVFKNYTREVIVAASFLIAYFPTLAWMWDRWFSRDSYYSHGILIPFVAGYLIWRVRDELKTLKIERSPVGIWLVLTGIIIHFLSTILRVYFTSGFSMLFVIFGLVFHMYGTQVVKKLLFPLSFLFFMIPLPLIIIVNISFQMKLFAAEIASRLLGGMGFLAVREGSIIRMQNAYIIVDDVCSGLRSLISLTALGSIFAYWINAPMYKKLILFLSTVPIAVITNVSRIVFLSTVSEIWGPQYAVGILHSLSGFLVFGLAYVLLYIAMRILE